MTSATLPGSAPAGRALWLEDVKTLTVLTSAIATAQGLAPGFVGLCNAAMRAAAIPGTLLAPRGRDAASVAAAGPSCVVRMLRGE